MFLGSRNGSVDVRCKAVEHVSAMMHACEAEACEMCHVHPGKHLGFLASESHHY